MSNGSVWFCANDSQFGSGYLWKTTDNGSTWSSVTSAGLHVWDAICEATPGVYYATAWREGVWRSSDSGATWTKVYSSTAWQFRGICASQDGSTLFLVTWNDTAISSSPGLIFYSTDNGSSWLPTDSPARNWWGISRGSDGVMRATASESGIYSLDPTTKSVKQLSTVSSSICGITDVEGLLYSAGFTGNVYFSLDRGVTVLLVLVMNTLHWQGVVGYNNGATTTLFISSEGDRIYKATFASPVYTTKIHGTFSGSGVEVFAARPSDFTFKVPLSSQTTTELTINKDFIAAWGSSIGRVRILVVDGEYISEWKDWDFRA